METETMEKNFGLTHSKIIKLLTPYLTVYPACKLEASGLMLYARALQDVPLDEIDAAMVKLMRTSKFFPSVAEILEAVKTTRDVIGGNDTSSAGAAWQEAMKLVKDIGPYGPWTYSSPAVERTVKQFGRMELCELKTDEMNTARAQFMRIYTAEEARESERENVRATLKAMPNGRARELVKRLADSREMEPKQLRAVK